MNLNVRISGRLAAHVKNEVEAGDFENVSEYVRDLIRRDRLAKDDAAFERLKAELRVGFAAPDEAAVAAAPEDVFERYEARNAV